MPVEIMTEPKFYSPLKVGLLIVAVAYFLFTLHAMFTLSWIGEWEAFSGSFRFVIFVEDISANIGIASRLVASSIAFAGGILYFVKKGLSTQTTMRVLRLVLIGEAIYWLGLLASGVLPLFSTLGFATWRVNGHVSTLPVLTSLLTNEIPLLVESIAIPIVLFKLSYELKPNKPAKGAIKWGLITGTVYVLVFWLTNTALWVTTLLRQGTEYLTSHPENLLSFALTSIGMLALTVFTAYFAKKSIGTETVEKLEENKEEILSRLDQIANKSKEKFDQRINIIADKVTVQNYYKSPEYPIALGTYAFASASLNVDFLVGKPQATPQLPDPEPYVKRIEQNLFRIADVLERQYRQTHIPKVKVIIGSRSGEKCRIAIENKGEEPITLQQILVKWKYRGEKGDLNYFPRSYVKKLFKDDQDPVVVTIPKWDMESKAPDTLTEEQIGNILSFVDVEAEIHYTDSQGKKYTESLKLL